MEFTIQVHLIIHLISHIVNHTSLKIPHKYNYLNTWRRLRISQIDFVDGARRRKAHIRNCQRNALSVSLNKGKFRLLLNY